MREYIEEDYEKEFSTLVGKKILGLYGSKETLEFATDAGIFQYGCEGDCCSSSWFEHVSGVQFLVGATVQKSEHISLNSITPEDEKKADVLQQYGFRLTTDKGYFEIDLRNDSNGYYGGNVTGPIKVEKPECPTIEADF